MTKLQMSQTHNYETHEPILTTTRPCFSKFFVQVTCTDNLVKYGRVVVEICERTDKQTNRQTDIHTNRQTNTLIAILRIATGGQSENRVCVYLEVT